MDTMWTLYMKMNVHVFGSTMGMCMGSSIQAEFRSGTDSISAWVHAWTHAHTEPRKPHAVTKGLVISSISGIYNSLIPL